MKLGTLLLRNAVIGLTQLEAALRNQVLYGGRLGTNLVELGFVELDLLADYLSELSGLPVATQELLDETPKEALDAIGPELAHDLGVVPLGATPDGALAVAMIDPNDADALAMIGERVGASVAPYVVPELRGLYYLEKHYGRPRQARFIRAGAPKRPSGPIPPADERRKMQPAGGLVMPPPVRLEPRRRRTNTAATSSPPPLQSPAISYGIACERIDAATHRDHIADALVDFARGRFDALVLFIVRDGNALGWRAHVATPIGLTAPIEELSLPLGGASSLQSAHDALKSFVGQPPQNAKPIEGRLWQVIGADPPPREIAVSPITVKQRVVNLVYAHAVGGGPLPPEMAVQLGELAVRAQTAYVRLIRSSKG
jgi:hypothetical protein